MLHFDLCLILLNGLKICINTYLRTQAFVYILEDTSFRTLVDLLFNQSFEIEYISVCIQVFDYWMLESLLNYNIIMLVSIAITFYLLIKRNPLKALCELHDLFVFTHCIFVRLF